MLYLHGLAAEILGMEMMASEKDFLFGWFGSENTGDDALLDQTFSICLDDI